MLYTVSVVTTLFVKQYQSAALICGQEGSWTGNTEKHTNLTLILLTWNIGWAPTNASKWQVGFNLSFKGLMLHKTLLFKRSKGRVTTSPDNNIAHTSTKCTQRNLFRMPQEIMEIGCKKKSLINTLCWIKYRQILFTCSNGGKAFYSSIH
jgi:hypothetical protein